MGHARSVVHDIDLEMVVVHHERGDTDVPILAYRVDGVIDDIQEDLLQLPTVASDQGKILLEVLGDFDVVVGGLRGDSKLRSKQY